MRLDKSIFTFLFVKILNSIRKAAPLAHIEGWLSAQVAQMHMTNTSGVLKRMSAIDDKLLWAGPS